MIPDVPEVPFTPLVPEVPDVPFTPLVPEVPDDPDVPLVPDDPDVPLVPFLPDVPDVPLVPAAVQDALPVASDVKTYPAVGDVVIWKFVVLVFPLTSNFSVGVVNPIPVLPLASITK